jgi:hypothetical protein
MSAILNLTRNRLLLALPSSNLKLPKLESIRCEREQVLMDADSSLDQGLGPVETNTRLEQAQRLMGLMVRLPRSAADND